MANYCIDIQEDIPASRDRVFALFADHVRFGRMLGVPVKRIRDAEGEDPNGIGSVRRVGIAGPIALEETITGFTPDEAIDYQVTSRSPIRNHQGTIRFVDVGEGHTRVQYTITFDDVIPFTGKPIHKALEKGIRKGIKRIPKLLAT